MGEEDKKAHGTIRLCLYDFFLLNVSKEKTTYALWNWIGEIYQPKIMVNKLYLKQKLFSLKMREGESIAENLNSFNLVLSQLASIDVNVEEEDKCIMLLCSLLESLDNFILSITANMEDRKMDALVATLLSQEMRKKEMDSTGDSLNIRGRPKERGSKGDKNPCLWISLRVDLRLLERRTE